MFLDSACVEFLAAIGVSRCSTPTVVKDERPISERGLASIDLQSRADTQRVVVSAILHNPDLGEQSHFATACYKDLFMKKGARTRTKINTGSVEVDIAQVVKQRRMNAYKSFPSTRYRVRAKIEEKTSITPPNDPLTNSDKLIDRPTHESLRDFSGATLAKRKWKAGVLATHSALPPNQQHQQVIRFGPLVSGQATNPHG